MPYTFTLEDVFSVGADAAVLGIENPVVPADGPTFRALAARGGDALRGELRARRFLSVGRAAAVAPGQLPFAHLNLTAAPRWNNGESCELTVLRLCYESVYALARSHGVRRLAMPILSANYYRFPPEAAIRLAFAEG